MGVEITKASSGAAWTMSDEADLLVIGLMGEGRINLTFPDGFRRTYVAGDCHYVALGADTGPWTIDGPGSDGPETVGPLIVVNVAPLSLIVAFRGRVLWLGPCTGATLHIDIEEYL